MPIRGIITALSRNKDPEGCSTENMMEWYDQVHIPDVLAKGGIDAGYRYRSTNDEAYYPFLVLYPVEDTGFVETPEFNSLSLESDKYFGPGKKFTDYADFEIRICARERIVEPEGTKTGRTKFVLMEAAVPGLAGESAFQEWYGQSYLQSLSDIPGYRRSTLYRLAKSTREDCPKIINLHEFEDEEQFKKSLKSIREKAETSDKVTGAKFEDNIFTILVAAGNTDGSL